MCFNLHFFGYSVKCWIVVRLPLLSVIILKPPFTSFSLMRIVHSEMRVFSVRRALWDFCNTIYMNKWISAFAGCHKLYVGFNSITTPAWTWIIQCIVTRMPQITTQVAGEGSSMLASRGHSRLALIICFWCVCVCVSSTMNDFICNDVIADIIRMERQQHKVAMKT